MWLRMLFLPAVVLGGFILTTPGRAEAQAPPDKALIVVRLPAGAMLLIGSGPTSQTGAERLFLSPPLEPGKQYSYELTAEWKANGQPHKVVREAVVRAGATTVVDFSAAQK